MDASTEAAAVVVKAREAPWKAGEMFLTLVDVGKAFAVELPGETLSGMDDLDNREYHRATYVSHAFRVRRVMMQEVPDEGSCSSERDPGNCRQVDADADANCLPDGIKCSGLSQCG